MSTDAELLFLVLQHLDQTACNQAAAVLEQEALHKGLLPTRIDIQGTVSSQHASGSSLCMPLTP